MNQSFNNENFIKIFYKENKKGVYLENKYIIFKSVRAITKTISDINKKFKTEQKYNKELKEKANRVKNKLKTKKYNELKIIFDDLERKIESDNIVFKVERLNKRINNRSIYTIKRDEKLEIFFTLKQVQKNIKKSFKIIQSNRYEISNQVMNMLDNDFPKFVIRTDIKNFFESIPHKKLKEKIYKNNILNAQSKNIIFDILNQYKKLSNSDKGIPRGVGISSYLAELYMIDIDNKIKALSNVTYYSRYVDDIIVIFTPNTKYDKIDQLEKIKKIVECEEILLNEEKTQECDLHKSSCIQLEFLGYFITKVKGIKIDVSITESKIKKYKEKIDLSINNYIDNNNERLARKLLRNRLKYLTGNTRLLNAKKDILIGIYFSNILLTNTNVLDELDKYLKNKLVKLDLKIQDKFNKYSFKKGFESKIFYKFNINTLKDIVEIWR
jgi:hypothetical protein